MTLEDISAPIRAIRVTRVPTVTAKWVAVQVLRQI